MFKTKRSSTSPVILLSERQTGAELLQKTHHEFHAPQSLAGGPTIAWLHQPIQPTPLMKQGVVPSANENISECSDYLVNSVFIESPNIIQYISISFNYVWFFCFSLTYGTCGLFTDSCHLAPADRSSPLPKKLSGWHDPRPLGQDTRVFDVSEDAVMIYNVSKAIQTITKCNRNGRYKSLGHKLIIKSGWFCLLLC